MTPSNHRAIERESFSLEQMVIAILCNIHIQEKKDTTAAAE
jgi:hypothetical protein